jgi:hypothetical protein
MASYPGTYIVKATYANLSDTAVIIVNQPKSLVITPPADTIEVGYTGTFTAYGLDASGNKVMVNPVWSANVDARGVFKATQVGVYQVIARQGKLADTAIVTVIPVKSCTEYNLGDIIEAENWCHMEGVQTEPSGDVGLGINVGYIDKGDWMEYWLKTDTGTYDFNLRVAAMSVVGQVSLLLKGDGDDDTLVSKAPLVITGDWQKWKTVKIRVTFKKAGLRKLVLMTDVGGWNLNWIQITPLSPPTIDMTKYVNISPKTATIELGYNQKFTAQAYDKNMFKIDALPSWSLSAPSSIDASGLFTPVKAGNYKVYAMVGNVKDSVNVLVIPAKVCVETRFGVKAEAEKWCHMSGITSELSKDGDSIVKFEGNTTWAEYVLVTEPGTFEINARIFTREPVKTTIVIKDAVIDTLVSSFNMLGTVSSVWKTVKMKATFKTSGLKTIRISSTGGIWKLDWLNVLPVSTDNIEAVETKSVSRLFPNPLSGNVVSIESPLFEVNSPVTIQIADIDGREVFKEKTVVLEDGSYSLRLPSKLIHGVYVLAITSSSKLETLKLVVE